MSSYYAGTTATLAVEWDQYPGGPTVDVTNLTITIKTVSGVVVLGPTSAGIVHLAQGQYNYPWAISPFQAAGDYVAVWDALNALSQPVQTSEQFTVLVAGAITSSDSPCVCPSCPPGVAWAPIYSPTWQWSGNYATVQAYAEGFAIDVIWALTGRQFGLCPVTMRPFWGRTLPAYLTYPSIYNPGSQGGQWAWGLVASGTGTNLVFGPNGGLPYDPPQIPLPPPVYPDPTTVTVTVDGVILDPSAYHVDGFNLVRTDGKAWTYQQDLTKAAGQPNTWTVSYLRGAPVPPTANRAAGLYAIEVAKGALQDPSCRLSQRIQSVTRQGVSAQMVSQGDYITRYRTGLPEVDILLAALNPGALPSPPRVVSLDMPQYRVGF